MRAPAAIAVLAACLCFPATAGAQAGSFESFVAIDSGAPARTTSIELHQRGSVAVDFHGDNDRCAAAGVCGVSGTVVWTAPREGELELSEPVRGGTPEAYLVPGIALFANDEPVVQVERRLPDGSVRTCADAAVGANDLVELPVTGTTIHVGLAGTGDDADLVRSRCIGPLWDDVRAALPSVAIDASELRDRRAPIDLSGRGTFTSGGLSGRVSSSLVLTPKRVTHEGPRRARRGTRHHSERVHRRHRVAVRWRIESVTGRIGMAFAGAPDDPLCGPLDACGSRGSVELRFRGASGSATLAADAPAQRRLRDLQAAVGLRRGGHRGGLHARGYGSWRATGMSHVTLAREGGMPACSSTAPLASGSLDLRVRGGRLAVRYGGPQFGLAADPLRSRCGGPVVADLPHALAAGSVPLSALLQRRVTLHLSRGAPFTGQGWSGSTGPVDVTIVLRRTSVRTSAYSVARDGFEIF